MHAKRGDDHRKVARGQVISQKLAVIVTREPDFHAIRGVNLGVSPIDIVSSVGAASSPGALHRAWAFKTDHPSSVTVSC